ncbi:MAG TPA: hypothetical protein VJ183_11205 [Chloroflexia bacterium]|nr:hypothetical protein [Chloroflexia bacterium]
MEAPDHNGCELMPYEPDRLRPEPAASYPSAIYLADLVRAFQILAPRGPETRRAIAELLGLRAKVMLPEVSKGLSEPPEPPEPPLEAQLVSRTPMLSPTEGMAGEAYDEPGQETYIPAIAETSQSHELEVPLGNQEVAGESPELHWSPPELEPLFVPSWTRVLLTAALATEGGNGPLDLDKLVEAIAKQIAVQQVPRSPEPTLRRGVQVLVDISEAMLPYSADQEVLQAEIARVVGTGRLSVRYFAGDPMKAGCGPRWDWRPYVPPPPGTVVLLLTDLGIGEPPLVGHWSGVEEWRDFATMVRRSSCPLVAFVPYAPARWPEDLRKQMTIIHWDRPTTAGTIRRIVGAAHKVVT